MLINFLAHDYDRNKSKGKLLQEILKIFIEFTVELNITFSY